MDLRKTLIIVVIVICVISLIFGIVFAITKMNGTKKPEKEEILDIFDFDASFDNSMNFQNYSFRNEYKTDTSKELVYTVYELNQKEDGKYDIRVELPFININSTKVNDINTEIITTFGQKIQNILGNAKKDDFKNTIYTVEYTAYLNENILSIVVKSTLKEGNNAQRLIIKAYTYNVSSNEIIPLKNMLEIKEIEHELVKNEIKKTVQEGISKAAGLTALGYNIYQRNINNDMYEIENSNNYFLGPDGIIYIIYAYGNMNYTSEKDIVVIK